MYKLIDRACYAQTSRFLTLKSHLHASCRFAGYVFKRVGKLTLSAIGGGILVLQV